MIDLIKKSVMMSLGVAFITKEKVEELAHEFIEKGKLSGQEGREFVDDLLKKSAETSQHVEEQITAIVNDTLKKLNFATQEDVQNLKNEIADLKQTLKQGGETV